jgi:hypothetical protein
MSNNRDLSSIVKIHVPTLDFPVPKLGAGLEGVTDFFDEVKRRIPELVWPLKLVAVGAGFTLADLVGHQFFASTKAEKTPTNYYGTVFLFSIPSIMMGRIASDLIGGPNFFKAFVIGTVANVLIQLRYLFTDMPSEFNWTNFLIHEAVLVPLSYLVAGDESSILGKIVA